MNQQEMRETIAQMRDFVQNETPKDLDEIKLHMMLMAGLALVGELLVDVKRIADAAESSKVWK